MKALILLLAVFSSANAVIFYCDYKMYTWLVVGSCYTCEVYGIEDENPTQVDEFRGDHLPGLNESDVKAFSIYYVTPTLPKIPTGIETTFENLLVFRWTESLTTLTADDLKPFPDLVVFFVRNANLFSIDGDVFQHNTNLNYIALDFNRIEHIGFGFLDGLTQLTSFYFHSNICLNAYATNSDVIEIVRMKIAAYCPPYEGEWPTTTVATTTVEPCDIRCDINDELDQLKQHLAAATYKIDSQGKRIEKLEKQMKNLIKGNHSGNRSD